MKQIDEQIALKKLQSKAKIDYSNHTIKISNDGTIGLKLIGVLDYLHKVFKWSIFKTSEKINNKDDNDDNKKRNYRNIKKENKTPKLTDKTKKKSSK